jgi:hypothetical protein
MRLSHKYTVLAEVEEADEADEVDAVDGESSGEQSFAFLEPGSGEGDDRGPQEDGDVDAVAAVSHADFKMADRVLHEVGQGHGAAATEADDDRGEPDDASRKAIDGGLGEGREQEYEAGQEADAEQNQEASHVGRRGAGFEHSESLLFSHYSGGGALGSTIGGSSWVSRKALSRRLVHLGLRWCDIPHDREARIVSKRTAEQVFGAELVRQYIERE